MSHKMLGVIISVRSDCNDLFIFLGRWNSHFILLCLYIVTDVKSQGCMLLPFVV